MPLLTYAGLSAPKRRNDGRTCSHMASSNTGEKTRSPRCHDLTDDGIDKSGNEDQRNATKNKRLSRSKEQSHQIPTSSKLVQENNSKAPFQLSNNTAMRLYNSSHPHRENHQRLSSRRQAPYASAPSSPWKSGYSSNSSSTYLCPTAATQARQNGSISRSQIIQRDENFGSDPSLCVMSRSINGGLIMSNGHGKTTTKYNRSCSANSDHTSGNVMHSQSSLSRSHEEQSPRLNHRVLALGGTLSPKHQWLAAGPSGIKVSNGMANGGATSKASGCQSTSSSTCLSQSSLASLSASSTNTKRKSGNYQSSDRSHNGMNIIQVSKSSRISGRPGVSYNTSKPSTSNLNEKSKRKSFGSALPCPSSMSKSDSVAYKAASRTSRCPDKDEAVKLEERNSLSNAKNCAIPQTHHAISSSLTTSNGSSTLISSSLLSKVRDHVKKRNKLT